MILWFFFCLSHFLSHLLSDRVLRICPALQILVVSEVTLTSKPSACLPSSFFWVFYLCVPSPLCFFPDLSSFLVISLVSFPAVPLTPSSSFILSHEKSRKTPGVRWQWQLRWIVSLCSFSHIPLSVLVNRSNNTPLSFWALEDKCSRS